MTSQLNASQSGILVKTLTGEIKTFPSIGFGLVDVRDVAEAHLIALENPQAVGKRFGPFDLFVNDFNRLICFSKSISWKGLAQEMKRQFPGYPITVEEDLEPTTWTMDVSPLLELGKTQWIPFEQMIKDTVEGFIKVGVVKDLTIK